MRSSQPVSNKTGLEWYHSLFLAVSKLQALYRPGTSQRDTVREILATALDLGDSSCGMLALVDDGEPYRIHDTIDEDLLREDLLAQFDELAHRAIAGNNTASDKTAGQVALVLAVGTEKFGVIVLQSGVLASNPALLKSLDVFCVTAASLLRQHQDDLSIVQVSAVIDHLAEVIVTFDEQGSVETINAAAEQAFGYHADEIAGKSVALLVAEPLASQLQQGLGSQDIMDVAYPGREFEGRRKDGSVFPMDVSLSRITVHGRDLFVGIMRDMSEYKAREQQAEQQRATTATLEQLVRIDAVTNIANRRHFDETIENEVRRAAREQQPLSLILCDIDFFKSFNDRYGHTAGDKALRAVAGALDATFQRAGELAARYGGEEFGVVIPGVVLDEAARLAQAVQARIAELAIPHGASPVADYLTVSMGVASVVPGPHYDPLDLIDESDKALYRAKGAGRNRIGRADAGKTRQINVR